MLDPGSFDSHTRGCRDYAKISTGSSGSAAQIDHIQKKGGSSHPFFWAPTITCV
jgi:hypothetical protein